MCDDFLTHNAFRAPGAPNLEELREAPKKVEYLKRIYSRMDRNIVAHEVTLGAESIRLLDGVTFAFLSLDAGEAKRLIVESLRQSAPLSSTMTWHRAAMQMDRATIRQRKTGRPVP